MADFTVTADLRQIQAFAGSLEQVLPAARRAARVPMRRVSLEGEKRVKQRVRVDTGHERRTVTSAVDDTATGLVARIGTNAPYAEVNEEGRTPGKPMPPKGALVGWMRRHGIPAEMEFVVRRAIGRKGIAGDHAFETTVRELTPMLIQELATIGPAIAKELDGGR